ncbi:hypothetical protein L6452_18363 [Arctium lappa]|uniref:Uncharacterized protein n=1 Tax=Arctium lappa TaxID=4217 RepID=A0ACB9C644_ARCLA|nr:hypothetical protein L6452_18363 [Arctium lappa]
MMLSTVGVEDKSEYISPLDPTFEWDILVCLDSLHFMMCISHRPMIDYCIMFAGLKVSHGTVNSTYIHRSQESRQTKIHNIGATVMGVDKFGNKYYEKLGDTQYVM